MPNKTTKPLLGQQNEILGLLGPQDIKRIAPHLQEIKVERGTVLHEPGDEINYSYFPCGHTLVSYVVVLQDGRCVETALIGKEGAVGGIVSEGTLPAYCRAVVHFPGTLLRIDAARLEDVKAACPNLRQIFARYADCLMSQVFQSVACNATHTIEQRTAKWLLMVLDRTDNQIVPFGQEQIAAMLGVGRSYVARVISRLREQGILETRRGKLEILSLKKLNQLSCECSETVGTHFSTVLKIVASGAR